MAHFMNSEISTPLNNDLYTEYAGVFSFVFRLSTPKLFGFSLLEMYVYNGKVSTTFAPAENSTFALNGWFMHIYTVTYIYIYMHTIIIYHHQVVDQISQATTMLLKHVITMFL